MAHMMPGPFPVKPGTACGTSRPTPATDIAWGLFVSSWSTVFTLHLPLLGMSWTDAQWWRVRSHRPWWLGCGFTARSAGIVQCGLRVVQHDKGFHHSPSRLSKSSTFIWVLMVVSILGVDCCELGAGCYAVYGLEYEPGFVNDDVVRNRFRCLGAKESSADLPYTVNHPNEQRESVDDEPCGYS